MDKGFFKNVYKIVKQIPKGKVATYGQIALLMGSPRSARIVGYAMNCAPSGENLNCHRVVNKKGELCNEDIFGKGVQRALLIKEGVKFLEDGTIDMKLCMWDGSVIY